MTEPCEPIRDLAAGFVLGALGPDEERAVRAHLAACPEPHAEFAELGGVVPYLAESVPVVAPPEYLKARILAAAAADATAGAGAGTGAPAEEAAAPAGPRAFPSAAERARRAATRRQSPLAWVAGLAAVLAIAALGAWNVSLQGQLEVAREYERGLAAILDVAAEAGSQTAILSPAEDTGPSGLAAVAPDGRVAIVVRDLRPTSGTEVYEAWVIGSAGEPVAIGGFTVDADGTATLVTTGAPVEAGVTVALTHEPKPGATRPSGAPVAAGTVAGRG